VDASWHPQVDTGNVLFLDGAVRHVDFAEGLGTEFEYLPYEVNGPRPIIGSPELPPLLR
jgi:prepilin-type processing-associated H-X9-DG protein